MSRAWKWILLAIAGGLTWRWATHPMGLKLALWQRAWSQWYGSAEGRKLAARVRRRYDALRSDCPYQPDPTLRRHLDDNILPGLALYQVILGRLAGEAPAEEKTLALQETERLFRAGAGPSLLPGKALNWIPNPFPVLRRTVKRSTAQNFPPTGWDFTPVEDSPRRLAFDAHRCFYLDTLRRYNAAELVPLFCQFDDWMMAELPASIQWHRTRTLARGDEVCNFDWCNQV